MTKVLVPLAEGFEEIEAVTVVDVLRRAGVEVELRGLAAGAVTGSRGIKVVPDGVLDGVDAMAFDGVVLPGGGPGSRALAEDARVRGVLRDLMAAGRWIGAICAAPTVLAAAGLARGRRLTGHPAVHAALAAAGADVRHEERVVRDGNLITSQGPGTALEFAYALVAVLAGDEMVERLNAGILARL